MEKIYNSIKENKLEGDNEYILNLLNSEDFDPIDKANILLYYENLTNSTSNKIYFWFGYKNDIKNKIDKYINADCDNFFNINLYIMYVIKNDNEFQEHIFLKKRYNIYNVILNYNKNNNSEKCNSIVDDIDNNKVFEWSNHFSAELSNIPETEFNAAFINANINDENIQSKIILACKRIVMKYTFSDLESNIT